METDIPIEIISHNYTIGGYVRKFLTKDIKNSYETREEGLVLFSIGDILIDMRIYNKGKLCNMIYCYHKNSIFQRIETTSISKKRTYFFIQRLKNDTHQYHVYNKR